MVEGSDKLPDAWVTYLPSFEKPVLLESRQSLLRIARRLGKPILGYRGSALIYLVLDGSTTYLFQEPKPLRTNDHAKNL